MHDYFTRRHLEKRRMLTQRFARKILEQGTADKRSGYEKLVVGLSGLDYGTGDGDDVEMISKIDYDFT